MWLIAMSSLSTLSATELALVALQQGVTFTLSGIFLFLIILIVGGSIGWSQGFRAVVTIALFTILAYVLTVSGGQQFVNAFNRVYTNIPVLIAFALGRDTGGVTPLTPIITGDARLPLFFRVVLFVAIVAVASIYNSRMQWYSTKRNEPLAPFLGLITGAFIAVMWSSALVTFWQEYIVTFGNPGGLVSSVISALPDVGVFVPPLIAIFVLIMLFILVINFPKVWKA